MKILFAGQNYRITGGSDRVFIDEMTLLEKFGHEVAPFCAKHPDNFRTEWASYFPEASSFENPGIKDAVNYVYSSDAKRKITKILDKFSPDIAHCHIYYGKLTSSILGEIKRRGIPLVQTLHEYKIVCPVYTIQSNGVTCNECAGFKFYNVIKNRCNRGSIVRSTLSCFESYMSKMLGSIDSFGHFIAVSNFLRQTVIDMGVPEDKITTIHNYTDASLFVPNYTAGDYFLFFGRLEKNKGIWPMIEAFRRMPQVQLVIVGSGSEEVSMRSYIHQTNIKNIKMLGFMTGDTLSEIIRGALCVVVPSICHETFGLTITEAFAYGKPVIASRIGGIPEVISPGQDGLLVEPGDVGDLVDAVDYMTNNIPRSVEMGRAGRNNVERKFNCKIHYEKLMQVYAKCKE